jgi:pimeloyl-ACP methyl ester carboxylesterase
VRRLVLGLVALALAAALLPPLGARLFGWSRPDPRHLPPRHATVAIGEGLELHVRDLGPRDGPAVVLVHGLPSVGADWEEVPDRLASGGARAVVYDRVGFGYSTHPDPAPGRYTYESSARDLAGLLDALGIERAALAGWSYGGAVVQTFAVREPARVSQLVLIGAVGPAIEQDTALLDRLIASPVGLPLLAWLASVPPLARVATAATLGAAFGGAGAVPPGWTERAMATLALPGTLEAFVAEARRGEPAGLRAEAIAVPALVLHGARDLLVPLAVGEDLARRLPHAELVVVPDGSHMLPVTHPDLVAERIAALVGGG